MDALKVHEILREQLDHESRLVWQRLPALIITNSVLIVGLLMSLEYEHLTVLHIGLPIVGIVMSVAFAYILEEGARQQNKCIRALSMIEQEPEFEYMKARKLRVFTDMMGRKRRWTWSLGSYFATILALIAGIMWGVLIAFI